jgi:hypothetical protein
MTTVTKMRLSKDTLAILKNFASINSNILIHPGNTLKTVSGGKNILAEAKITEDFDVSVPLWDLNKFLGVISMFNNPDLEFEDKYVTISNGRSSVRYYYSAPELLTVPPSDIKMPKVLFSFDLDEHNLNELLKASSILQVNNAKIVADDGVIKIEISDSKNDTSDSFSVVVDENYSGPSYSGSFNVSEIKFMPGSYKVEITSSVISKFTHQSLPVSYYMAINKG